MATTSVDHERRIRRILAEAEERYLNEMLGDEERLELIDSIKRLRRAVESAKETVDAVHSGLERP